MDDRNHHAAPGKTKAQIDREALAKAMNTPQTTRCAMCDETFEGTAAEGIGWHRFHRKDVHGIPLTVRKKRKHRAFNNESHRLDEFIANARLGGSAVEYMGEQYEDEAA